MAITGANDYIGSAGLTNRNRRSCGNETENDLLGSGRLLYSFAPEHCASLNHADRKFYLFNISST